MISNLCTKNIHIHWNCYDEEIFVIPILILKLISQQSLHTRYSRWIMTIFVIYTSERNLILQLKFTSYFRSTYLQNKYLQYEIGEISVNKGIQKFCEINTWWRYASAVWNDNLICVVPANWNSPYFQRFCRFCVLENIKHYFHHCGHNFDPNNINSFHY